jgi:hypothetical protein
MFPHRLFPTRMFPRALFPEPPGTTDLFVDRAQLDCLRASAASSLPNVGEIVEDVLLSDGRGGHTETPVTIARPRCRIQRLKEPVEVVIADKTTVACGFKAWFPWGMLVNLTSEKRLKVLGVTYEIIGGVQNTSEEIFAVAFCNLVE